MPFVQYAIVEQHTGVLGRFQQRLDVVPQQTRGQFLSTQIAIDPVIADTFQVVSQVRHRVIDGAAQQILAVVEFSEAHPFSLSSLLRKS